MKPIYKTINPLFRISKRCTYSCKKIHIKARLLYSADKELGNYLNWKNVNISHCVVTFDSM